MSEQKSRDRFFALRIALFNTGGFVVNAAINQYLRQVLTTEPSGERATPLGYGVMCFTPLVFVGCYLSIVSLRSSICRILCPAIWSVLVYVVASLFAFPPFPCIQFLQWGAYYALAGLLGAWIRYHDSEMLQFRGKHNLPSDIGLEWLKETASMFRTIALSISIGLVSFVIPWWQANMQLAELCVTDRKEALSLITAWSGNLAWLCTCVILGPVLEAFGRAQSLAALILNLKSRSGPTDKEHE